MFETSVVAGPVQASARRYSLLTISLAAHSAVVIGAVAMSIATIDFPSTAPDAFARAPLFEQIQLPPQLGTPEGGSARPPAPEIPAPTPPPSNQVTAPLLIPDEVPQVEPGSGAVTSEPGPGTGTGSTGGPIGVPWGVEGGAGPLDGPPVTSTQPVAEERIYESHEVTPPRIVHRVDPPYPPIMIRVGKDATVIVRCVIGRDGRVRDAEVIHAALPPFNDAVLRAVQQWRFTPGRLGERNVDTYMNLTVKFSVR
jgi:periplasmic protein TonB